MTVLLVPPGEDMTLEVVDAERERLDLGEALRRRVLEPSALEAAAAAQERLETPAGLRGALLLRVAAALSGSTQLHARLRGLGAALAGLTQADALRFRLDDVELDAGSTERSGDVLAALARGPVLFGPELTLALDAAGERGPVELVLERDQQLPFVLALAQRLPARDFVLHGAFARQHAPALRTVFAFARSFEVHPEPVALAIRGGGLRWVRPGGVATTEPWAGPVKARELFAPVPALEGCRVAVVGVCALTAGVLFEDGSGLPREVLDARVQALAARGVRVVAEWVVGAPSVEESLLGPTLEAFLTGRHPFSWLAGVRAFHWPRAEAGPAWKERGARLEPEGDPASDLARNHRFIAEGTLTGVGLAARMESLAVALLAARVLSPGRVAEAYVQEPPRLQPGEGTAFRIAPESCVVQLARGLDGKPGPASYALNLRTGGTFALDPRIGVRFPPRGQAFTDLQLSGPAAAKAQQLLLALQSRGILEACTP